MGIFDAFRKKRPEEKSGKAMPQPLAKAERANAVGWRVGDTVDGRYLILRVLGGPGRSGMGIVYVCYDPEMHGPLALKTFQDQFLSDKATVDRFKWEAETWIRLGRHQNIVWATWVEVIQGRPYVAMEYVAGDQGYGVDLAGWIRGGGLRTNGQPDIPLILNFSLQLCHGMIHAKKRFEEIGKPFVHRDVKPSNIMVTQDRVVKVTDFGLVKAFAQSVQDTPSIATEHAGHQKLSLSKLGGVCGTPPYMSPEQCRGEKNIDERSDIYAFGCVLYEMLTGRHVFEVITPEEFIQHHLRTAPPSPQSGGELDRVVLKCLEKDPNSRYQGFDEVEQIIARLYLRLTGQVVRPPEGAPLEAWELVNKGSSLESLGFIDEAMQCNQEAIKIDPNCAEAHSNLGSCYAKKGHIDSAMKEFRETLRIDPKYFKAHCNMAIVYAQNGQVDAAMRECQEVLRINPRDAEAHRLLGQYYVQKGDFDSATKECREALKINAHHAGAHVCLGTIYMHKAEWDAAIKEFHIAATINPSYSEPHHNLGIAYSQKGQLDAAIMECHEAIRIDPNDAKAHLFAGYAYHNKGDLDSAMKEFQRAVRIDPNDAEAHRLLGNGYQDKGDLDSAAKEFREALRINPNDGAAHLSLGLAYRGRGELDSAIKEYQEALRINPNDAGAHLGLGVAHRHKGNLREAIECYEAFLNIAPTENAVMIEQVKQAIRQLKQGL